MALDDVCKTLNLTDGAKAAREVIAERIIELARAGRAQSYTGFATECSEESGLAGVTNGNGRWSGL